MRVVPVVGVVAAFLLTGCVHAEKRPVDVVTQRAPAPPPAVAVAPAPAPAPTADPMAEVDAALRSATVLFDFDRDQLKQDGMTALQKVATILRKHPSIVVQIEGNCDERGTEEYNLMLSQRRAIVAHRYLVDLGVNPKQLDTVGYGALRPLNPGHSEAAWSQNRRDELHASR